MRRAVEKHWSTANWAWLGPAYSVDPFPQVSPIDPFDARFIGFCGGCVVELRQSDKDARPPGQPFSQKRAGEVSNLIHVDLPSGPTFALH